MTALNHLRTKLLEASSSPFTLTMGGDLQRLNETFERESSSRGVPVDGDMIKRSVSRFWQDQRLESLRDAQLVSYGLTLRPDSTKTCILEDSERFRVVLDAQRGIGQWLNSPRWFRRCYKGLVSCYFTYDGLDSRNPSEGKENWCDLRDYLWQNTPRIIDASFNMDWVNLATNNRSLFSDDPCSEYAPDALEGDTNVIDELTNELGINRNSWFHWKLIMAQVRHATNLADAEFCAQIPKLISLIEGNVFVREKAMAQILDRYARSDRPVLNVRLRDSAVAWWGNPWLPSDEVRWGAVNERTRAMVAEWLRGHFVEAFFAKLAKDGVGDTRRARFWLKYLKSMTDVRFGLGSIALQATDSDFVVLRERMKGLFQRLSDTAGANNAFIMTIKNLVAVEFGGESNAFYGYDARKPLPFDLGGPLQTQVGVRNSLKHNEPDRVLRLQHQDRIRGFRSWEEMFAAELKDKFGILPDDVEQSDRSDERPILLHGEAEPARQASIAAFSISELEKFAAEFGFTFRDNRSKNGNLRIDTHDLVPEVSRVLRIWGFEYQRSGFWWRK